MSDKTTSLASHAKPSPQDRHCQACDPLLRQPSLTQTLDDDVNIVPELVKE
jgi:hypothetical protein